jgi:hypothetical protein
LMIKQRCTHRQFLKKDFQRNLIRFHMPIIDLCPWQDKARLKSEDENGRWRPAQRCPEREW